MSPAQRVQQYSSPMSTKHSVLTARPLTVILATVRYGRTLKSLASAQTEWFLFITECKESVASNRWPQVISSAQDLRLPMLFLLHRRIIHPRLRASLYAVINPSAMVPHVSALASPCYRLRSRSLCGIHCVFLYCVPSTQSSGTIYPSDII
jgi:hypothetical protein